MRKYTIEVQDGFEIVSNDHEYNIATGEWEYRIVAARIPAPTVSVELPRDTVEWLLKVWGTWGEKDTTLYGETFRALRAALSRLCIHGRTADRCVHGKPECTCLPGEPCMMCRCVKENHDFHAHAEGHEFTHYLGCPAYT